MDLNPKREGNMARTNLTRATLARQIAALSIVAFACSVGGPTSRAADMPNALPAYHLEVGQELTYKDDTETKRGEGPKKMGYAVHTDWKASVVGKNSDGSYRVVIRSSQTYKFDGRSSGAPHATFGYCDVFPDGRIISNPTVGVLLDPTSLFPKLPENAQQVAAGWEAIRDHNDGRCAFKVESQPKPAKDECTISEVRKTPLDEVYLVDRKATITFDAKRGLVSRIQRETKQAWGSKSTSEGTLVLVSVDKHDADWGKQLWADADRYFQADRAYDDKTTQATKNAKTCQKQLDEAKAILSAAVKDVTSPVFKEQLAEALKAHDSMAKYTLEDAERRAKVIGKPAAEFEAADLKGKSHTLKDYKGKVVVLDFWYRGCSWCMRAMPQMKQLAAEFHGAPVAVIGMNIDPNEADAKFVVDKFGLDYATLRIDRKLPQKFGVRGYPTLVIIDQHGNVHDLHVGYTPNLQQEIGEVVRQLLAKR
jgi:thiol-disulfide isomerase/thioredoxin